MANVDLSSSLFSCFGFTIVWIVSFLISLNTASHSLLLSHLPLLELLTMKSFLCTGLITYCLSPADRQMFSCFWAHFWWWLLHLSLKLQSAQLHQTACFIFIWIISWSVVKTELTFFLENSCGYFCVTTSNLCTQVSELTQVQTNTFPLVWPFLQGYSYIGAMSYMWPVVELVVLMLENRKIERENYTLQMFCWLYWHTHFSGFCSDGVLVLCLDVPPSQPWSTSFWTYWVLCYWAATV